MARPPQVTLMKKALFGGLSIVVAAFSPPLLAQTNGTWTNATSNSAWSTPSNWSGGLVADGVDAIADFSTLDIAVNHTSFTHSHRRTG